MLTFKIMFKGSHFLLLRLQMSETGYRSAKRRNGKVDKHPTELSVIRYLFLGQTTGKSEEYVSDMGRK